MMVNDPQVEPKMLPSWQSQQSHDSGIQWCKHSGKMSVEAKHGGQRQRSVEPTVNACKRHTECGSAQRGFRLVEVVNMLNLA